MRKFLLSIGIIQTRKETTKHGTFTYKRLNPFNPLTYVLIVLTFIIGTSMFGFVGVWEEVNLDELKFKWK
jgi:hypothetical protein